MKFGELHPVNKTFLGVRVGVMDWRRINPLGGHVTHHRLQLALVNPSLGDDITSLPPYLGRCGLANRTEASQIERQVGFP